MEKRQIGIGRPVHPTPAALITSVAEDGTPNIITLGEVFNISISNPVIVGIAIRSATYSHGLISRTREFVVNLPSTRIIEAVDRCGSVSGRSGIDKFEAFGLTPLHATHVKPPLIAECPINIECGVIEITTVGDHDLFLGEVKTVHADADTLDENGKPKVPDLDLFAYVRGEYWSFGERLGEHGFAIG